MKWESKNGESYLHVDGYKNQYEKDIIADLPSVSIKIRQLCTQYILMAILVN